MLLQRLHEDGLTPLSELMQTPKGEAHANAEHDKAKAAQNKAQAEEEAMRLAHRGRVRPANLRRATPRYTLSGVQTTATTGTEMWPRISARTSVSSAR